MRKAKRIPSNVLKSARREYAHQELLKLLNILDEIRRREESRPAYTSYFVNVRAHTQ